MKVIIDTEANGLKPTEIWCIVCKELGTCHKWIFRKVTQDAEEAERFVQFSAGVDQWIGHNILGYDLPVIANLLQIRVPVSKCLDTLIISKLVDYPRGDGKKHSVKDYGIEFGLHKGDWTDYKNYSEEAIEYCERDVDITERIYLKFKKYIDNPKHKRSILKEHRFQLSVNNLENNGFGFDIPFAEKQLGRVEGALSILDKDILSAFPPRLRLIREIHPKVTKHGTLSRTDFRFLDGGDLSEYNGGSFSRCSWEPFNPGSPRQIVQVLSDAGWSPIEKTKGHIQAERDVNALKRQRHRSKELDTKLQESIMVLERLRLTGWKTSENNLATLPKTAPPAARLIAQRILYEARRKTLTEWLGLVNRETSRVHGRFYGIGAWTHRMSHQKPNMANITNAVRVSDGKTSLLGKELRQCWIAPKGRLLVGVDAEAIQLRVFAHLINDPVLIDAIVNGKKSDGTDPHSLNKSYFGSYCKTRNAAKHSLYAMFFGGTASMLSHIMDCSRAEAQLAIDALIKKYPGLEHLQKEVFPIDARRGYFIGLDGRKVRIPGETVKDREHLCMSGYLQNGEKVIMSEATVRFESELPHYDSFLVDLVHDEWQNECPNNYETCEAVAQLECKALVDVGVDLELNCPLAGSYFNDAGKPTFGRNWYMTH